MIETADRDEDVAKKQADQAKRYGTLIRVSDAYAEAVREVAHREKVSIADYLDAHYLASVQKKYRDAVLKEAKKFEGKE